MYTPRRVDVFRSTAWYYAQFRPGYPPEQIERLAEVAGLGPESRVLDLACGTGLIAIPLASRAGEVLAVDAEPAMLAMLRLAAPGNIRALEARGDDVDESWGRFDLVTIGRALHWLGGPEYLDRLVPITRQVALLGDRVADSESHSIVLDVAQEIAGERPKAPAWHVRYDEALAASAFSDVVDLSVDTVRTWTQDDLIGWAFSTSFASPDRLGERREEFVQALRDRLAPRYQEQVRMVALLGRRRDE
jgi:SAM-dependent methyltransferase